MSIIVSTWSGTYNTQVTLALPHPSPSQPGAATDETLAARTSYSEHNPPITHRKLCSVKYLPAFSRDHETEIEITGPDPESIRAFLLEMLAALPEPPMFTDGEVLELTSRDAELFIRALDDDSPPNDALSAAAERYRVSRWH